MYPMGMDWRPAVALMAGASAKEIVVSTMGVLYTGTDDNETMLSERLMQPSPITGKPPFTPMTALAFMVFVLVYFPYAGIRIVHLVIQYRSGLHFSGIGLPDRFALCLNRNVNYAQNVAPIFFKGQRFVVQEFYSAG